MENCVFSTIMVLKKLKTLSKNQHWTIHHLFAYSFRKPVRLLKIFKNPKMGGYTILWKLGTKGSLILIFSWKPRIRAAYNKIKEQPNTGLYNLLSIYCRILSFGSKLTSEMNTSICNKTLLWWQPKFILSNPKLALSVYHDLTFCSIQPHMKD